MGMGGGATSSLPPTHRRLGLSQGFPCMRSSGKGDGLVDAQHRGGLCSDSPPLPDKREEFNGPGEQEEKKICREEGGIRQRIDNNRSANNGQAPVMHKSHPRAAFILGQLSVRKAHSPQTSGTAEDKGDEKEY